MSGFWAMIKKTRPLVCLLFEGKSIQNPDLSQLFKSHSKIGTSETLNKPAVVAEWSKALSKIQVERMP